MGWNATKEGGTKRPYVFAIDDQMIYQGMRSSGIATVISHFKPVIAKYIYSKYNVKKTIDYSCGWGARCVAALSLGIEYYGMDPLTGDKINDIIKYFDGVGKSVSGCSEVFDYSIFPDVDLSFSCPPYFDLETYSDANNQSIANRDYNTWLDDYWAITVQKCYEKSKYFAFVAVEKVRKHELLSDLGRVCEESGGVLVDKYPIQTASSHLSGKAKTKKVNKKTEHLVVYKV